MERIFDLVLGLGTGVWQKEYRSWVDVPDTTESRDSVEMMSKI